MDVCALRVAYSEPAQVVEPGEAAFDHPAMLAEFFVAFNAPARNAWRYPPLATSFPAAGIIIAFIGVVFLRPALRTARLAASGRHCVKHFVTHLAVLDIRSSESHRKRSTVAIGREVPFCARLASTRWIWARGKAPFLAVMDEESMQSRLKSSRFAPR